MVVAESRNKTVNDVVATAERIASIVRGCSVEDNLTFASNKLRMDSAVCPRFSVCLETQDLVCAP